MKKPVIAIVGGSQEKTFKKIGQKLGCEVIFHGGKKRNGAPKKDFIPLIERADVVVVLKDCCGHLTMDVVKEQCKLLGKIALYPKGFGATGPIKMALEKLEYSAA